MENFNLNGLTNTQLNELYFKVKKIMVIKRKEFSELDMQLGCLLATIDIEMNRVPCISCDEQNEVINTYINK
jgi:CRISPR/Cas system CSM-associated protein Csm2 small subunit